MDLFNRKLVKTLETEIQRQAEEIRYLHQRLTAANIALMKDQEAKKEPTPVRRTLVVNRAKKRDTNKYVGDHGLLNRTKQQDDNTMLVTAAAALALTASSTDVLAPSSYEPSSSPSFDSGGGGDFSGGGSGSDW